MRFCSLRRCEEEKSGLLPGRMDELSKDTYNSKLLFFFRRKGRVFILIGLGRRLALDIYLAVIASGVTLVYVGSVERMQGLRR
jgi:hypothetical protein